MELNEAQISVLPLPRHRCIRNHLCSHRGRPVHPGAAWPASDDHERARACGHGPGHRVIEIVLLSLPRLLLMYTVQRPNPSQLETSDALTFLGLASSFTPTRPKDGPCFIMFFIHRHVRQNIFCELLQDVP